MPIDRELIPELIKTSEIKTLEGWKRDYFEKVAKALQVHTKGQLFTKVDTLFPNEHPDSKAHVIATYEPITKSSIWKGINNLFRIFSSSSFSINVGEDVSAWLEDYEHDGQNLLNYFLQEWVSKAVAEDPNGLFVVYPPDYAEEKNICPIQWVRSELIKSKTDNFISFVSEHDSEIQYKYFNTSTKRDVFYDQSVESMNARSWTETTYNERLRVHVVKEVVHLFTLEGFIVYKKMQNNTFETTIIDFADTLSQLPLFPGGGVVTDKADQLLYESFVQAFVPFGNLALLQHRNHRAVDLQFSYPRMSELQVPCDHKGCNAGQVKCHKTEAYPNGMMPCPTCKGKSFVTVQSPYKVYTPRYDPNDTNENKHLQVDPVKFYSPDVGIINYSKDAWKDYVKLAEVAIFITQKKETGNVETVESKDRDLDELYSWLLGPAKVFYNNLRLLLQCLEDYMSRSPTRVSVERPYSFAILTESEAFIMLNNILTSDAHVSIKANRVENFVNKFVSKDNPIHRAYEILKQYDPLLFYSDGQVSNYKGSNAITQEMQTKHILAYPTFLKLYMQDPGLVFESDEVIMKKMDKEIETLKIGAGGENFRQTIIKRLSEEPAA